MREFMLLTRNDIDSQESWSPESHRQFLKACETYITGLKREGHLISAQPLLRQGTMLSCVKGQWKEGPFYEGKEIIVGYYHIQARDINEAVGLAQRNPEFEYSTTARVEVRPIKMKEEMTGFVYPEKR